MASLYSNEVRQFIKSRQWPKGLRMEVVEFPEFLRLRFFRDNLNSFDSEDKLQIAKLVNEVMMGIRKNGIPIYTEVAKGDGNGAA